jgi:hypothetical protein
VWYRWVAPVTGAFRINTAGSSFNTKLAVTSGDSILGPTVILINDNAGGPTETSAPDFTAGICQGNWSGYVVMGSQGRPVTSSVRAWRNPMPCLAAVAR